MSEKEILSVRIVSPASIITLFVLLSITTLFVIGLGIILGPIAAGIITYIISIQLAKSKRRALQNLSSDELEKVSKKNAIERTVWTSITRGEVKGNRLTLYSEEASPQEEKKQQQRRPRSKVIKASLKEEDNLRSEVNQLLSSKLGEKFTMVN